MSKPRIILNVSGGVVQDVFCSDFETEVILVDWDTEGCDSSDDDVFQIGGRAAAAFVARVDVAPCHELAGTDVEAALRAAQIAI